MMSIMNPFEQKGFGWLGLLIVLAIIIGGGYWVWQNRLGSPTSKSTVDISNWKTYRNEEYGFEFKYPGNFLEIKENNEPWGTGFQLLFLKYKSGSLSLIVLNQPLDPKNIQNFYEIKIENPETRNVGRKIGYVFGDSDAGCGIVVVQTALGSKTLQVGFSGCEGETIPSDNVWQDKILSTFKFIK